MPKKIPILLICFSAFFNCSAQQSLPVSAIPAVLLEKANAVVRYSTKEINIKSAGNAVVKNSYALTILNAAAEKHAQLALHYDRFNRVRSIEGKLYDASGNKIRSLRKNEVQDITGNPDAAFADDTRYKLHNFNWQIYPYTIEYETVEEMDGIFYLPSWTPVEDEYISVEKSVLKVETPLDYPLRYKAFNFNNVPLTETGKKSTVYTWSLASTPAIEEEAYCPAWHEISPSVLLAPEFFEIGGYSGNMANWEEFGKFIYSLAKGKEILPQNIKSKVHELTDNFGSVQEKIKMLYEYMQQNTHYISIQLGLGGWQPFDAGFVASKGYGDCKALSNYMYALLKEAGIKSHYCLIRAGESAEPIVSDFSSNQFNHIIVCVPTVKDTVWLECTSQTIPYNYLGAFTSNRMALLTDESGAKLVRTPVYNKNDNLQSRKIIAELAEDGSLNATMHTSYRAEQQDDLHGFNNALPKDRVEQYLKEELSIPSYDLLAFEYKEHKDKIPVMNEMLKLKANNYASVSGKRLFINPNMLNQSRSKLKNPEKRTQGILIRHEYIDTDSVEISIPAGYKPESVPESLQLITKFGKFSSKTEVKNGKIFYTRKNERNAGRFPVADAPALAEYFDKIYRADRSRVVLVKEAP